jgi:hypothetical protein
VDTFLPKLKYVIRLTPGYFKAHPITRKPPSVYVSDRNVIERGDAASFRRMIMEILNGYHEGKEAAFTQITKSRAGLQFQVDKMNYREFEGRCAEAQTVFLQPNKAGQVMDTKLARAEQTKFKVLLEYLPFRNIALVGLGETCFIRINLLTREPLSDMQSKIKRKVLDIFWLVRRAVKDDLGAVWTMKMDIDLVDEIGAKEATGDIDRAIGWMSEVSRAFRSRSQ